jgi:hypothetical protein
LARLAKPLAERGNRATRISLMIARIRWPYWGHMMSRRQGMSQHNGASIHEAYGKALEERLYALATDELTHNKVRVGLWAKAWSMARGKDRRAKAHYLALRVEMMLAEHCLQASAADWRLRIAIDHAA